MRVPSFKNTTKILREDPQREKKSENSSRRGKKKTRNFGPPPFEPPPFGPPRCGTPPFGPSTLFLGLGSHPSGALTPLNPHPSLPPTPKKENWPLSNLAKVELAQVEIGPSRTRPLNGTVVMSFDSLHCVVAKKRLRRTPRRYDKSPCAHQHSRLARRTQGCRHNLVRLSVTHVSLVMSPRVVSIAQCLRQLGRFQRGPEKSSHFGDLFMSLSTQMESFWHHELATTNRLHEMAAGNRTDDDGLDFSMQRRLSQPWHSRCRNQRSCTCSTFQCLSHKESPTHSHCMDKRTEDTARSRVTRRLYVQIAGSRRRRLEHFFFKHPPRSPTCAHLFSHLCSSHLCTPQNLQILSGLYLPLSRF